MIYYIFCYMPEARIAIPNTGTVSNQMKFAFHPPTVINCQGCSNDSHNFISMCWCTQYRGFLYSCISMAHKGKDFPSPFPIQPLFPSPSTLLQYNLEYWTDQGTRFILFAIFEVALEQGSLEWRFLRYTSTNPFPNSVPNPNHKPTPKI